MNPLVFMIPGDLHTTKTLVRYHCTCVQFMHVRSSIVTTYNESMLL